jgi:hypothetical protein
MASESIRFSTGLVNMPVHSVHFARYHLHGAAGEGRRGWALLRASLHDPLLVLNIESEVAGGARATAAQVCTAVTLVHGPCALRVIIVPEVKLRWAMHKMHCHSTHVACWANCCANTCTR